MYDTVTGHCTIPSSGRYLITVQLYGNNRQATFNLVIDGKASFHIHANDPADGDPVVTGTLSTVLEFEQGQKLAIYPHIGANSQIAGRFAVNKLN